MTKARQYKYKYKGRPTKLTEECVGKLEEAFSVGANVKQACYYANIHRDTYYTWIKENPDLSDRFEDLKQKLPLQALHNIASKIHGKPTTGDINLSKWLLEKRMKEEYGDELTIKDDRLGLGTPEEDLEVISEFHKKLKENRLRRSREKAIEDGEIKE